MFGVWEAVVRSLDDNQCLKLELFSITSVVYIVNYVVRSSRSSSQPSFVSLKPAP